MKLRRTAERKALFVTLTWGNLPAAFFASLCGYQIEFIDARVSRRTEALIEDAGIARRFVPSAEDWLNVPSRAYIIGPETAAQWVATSKVRRLAHFLASCLGDSDLWAASMQIHLIKILNSRQYPLLKCALWLANREPERSRIFTASSFDRLLLRQSGVRAKITKFPVPAVTWRDLRRATQKAAVMSTCRRRRKRETGAAISHEGANPTTDKSVFVVFHDDDRYGALWKIDHFFDSDPTSPLFRGNTVQLSRDGGSLSSGFQSEAYPIGGQVHSRLLRSVRLIVGCFLARSVVRPLGLTLRLCWFVASAEQCAREIQRRWPTCTVAWFAYEIQVPHVLALGFQLAGVRTVALQERPEAVIEGHAPFIVDTLLAVSPEAAGQALASPFCDVREAIPVGHWRSDYISDSVAQGVPAQEMPTGASKFICAFPYRPDDRQNLDADTVAMSFGAVKCFLDSMIELAKLRHDCLIVVRGKSDDWLAFPEMAEALKRVAEIPNIILDRNYDVSARAYALCAQADLVVGHYSSIMDECRSTGIPTLIHDFTENAKAIRSQIRTDWAAVEIATDRLQFLARADFILSCPRELSRSELADGEVRQRSRRLVSLMVAESPDSHSRSF